MCRNGLKGLAAGGGGTEENGWFGCGTLIMYSGKAKNAVAGLWGRSLNFSTWPNIPGSFSNPRAQNATEGKRCVGFLCEMML